MAPVAFGAEERDQAWIAVTPTLSPLAKGVSQTFDTARKFKPPSLRVDTTTANISMLCAGAGPERPDAALTIRRLTSTELRTCYDNGVKPIELQLGVDGIVMAAKAGSPLLALTPRLLYLALAKTVPVNGKLIPNPYSKWNQIDPSLPAREIEVIGPAIGDATRSLLHDLVMEGGCRGMPTISKIFAAKERVEICTTLRDDNRYTPVPVVDQNRLLAIMNARPNAIGIMGFALYRQFESTISALTISGIAPSPETIGSGTYPLSRSLYFYVKRNRLSIVPGLQEYASHFISEKTLGNAEILLQDGIVPLPPPVRARVRQTLDRQRVLHM
jgi:phosphate transport system substrate-binding protein